MLSKLSPKQSALFKQFLLVYTGLLLVMSLILSSWYNLKSDQELEYLKQQELRLLKLHETSIFQEYESVLSDLMTLGSLPITTASLINRNPEQAKTAQLANIFQTVAQTRGRYDQIRYLNENGQEIIRVNYNHIHASIVPDDKLQNKANRYYVRDISKLRPEEIYVSRMDLNIENNQVEQPPKPIIRVGMRLFDSNKQPQGSIVLNYFGQHLLDTLDFGSQVLNSRSSLMLLDQDGYWLKGPNPEKEWGFMFANKKQVSFASEHPKLWQRMQKQKSGQIRTSRGLYSFKILLPLKPNDHTRHWHYDYQKTTFKTHTQLEDYQWVLISFLPASKFYTETQDALLDSIPYIFIGLLLLAVLAYYLATYYIEKQYLLYKTHYMAFHDELTGLFNRHVLSQEKGLHLVLPADKSIPYTVFFFDLDGFKPINDHYGHHIGDEVLQTIAKRLQSGVREHDVLIRLGGDEFVLITPKLSNKKHAEYLGQKLLHKIQEPIHIDEHILQLGASIGVAMYPKHSGKLEKLIDLADNAMYEAKQSGKGRVCFPEETNHLDTDI